MAWPDVGRPILVVPVGSCEQHGPHLPLHTDTVIADALAHGLARPPPTASSPRRWRSRASGEHQGFPARCRSAPRRWSTSSSSWCGRPTGRRAWCSSTATAATPRPCDAPPTMFGASGRPVLAWWPRARRRRPARRPRRDLADAGACARRGPRSTVPSAGPRPALAELVAHGVRAVSASGVLGDPTTATADEGRRLFDELADQLADAVARLDRVSRGRRARRAMRYRLDASVQRFGRVVIGGSPLKLFRLTDAGAARASIGIAAGERRAPTRSWSTALVEAGAIHPDARRGAAVHRRRRHDRGADARRRSDRRVPAGAIIVDDGSAGRRCRRGAPAATSTAGRRQRATPGWRGDDAAGGVRRHRRRARPTAGWIRCSPTSPTTASALVAPRGRRRAAASARSPRYEREHSPLDLGAEPARIRAGTRVSYVPAAAIVCRVDALRAVGGFDESLRSARTSTSCGGSTRPAGVPLRAGVEVSTPAAGDVGAWVRQRIGYGSSAAPLARRHPGALAPIRMSGWSVAAWVLAALGRPVAGAAVGVGSAAALVRKLPDVPPGPRSASPPRATCTPAIRSPMPSGASWWPIAGRRRRAVAHGTRGPAGAPRSPPRNPVRLADDLAYSVGRVEGDRRRAHARPARARDQSWPGRRPRPIPPDPTSPHAGAR